MIQIISSTVIKDIIFSCRVDFGEQNSSVALNNIANMLIIVATILFNVNFLGDFNLSINRCANIKYTGCNSKISP